MIVVIELTTLAEAMTVAIELAYPAVMARSPARARMVQSAATLIRERGIHGTGLREVVAHSRGPRGSLGRFFPGGKTQLVTEAIDVALLDRALIPRPNGLPVVLLAAKRAPSPQEYSSPKGVE